MFALPLLKGNSRIIITTPLESRGYIDLTIDTLKKFSIAVENRDYKEFFIKGDQCYKAANCCVEGDFSQAAFWLAAGALGAEIRCMNITRLPSRGQVYIRYNLEMGKPSMAGFVRAEGGSLFVELP